jgi:hypothetical protein
MGPPMSSVRIDQHPTGTASQVRSLMTFDLHDSYDTDGPRTDRKNSRDTRARVGFSNSWPCGVQRKKSFFKTG